MLSAAATSAGTSTQWDRNLRAHPLPAGDQASPLEIPELGCDIEALTSRSVSPNRTDVRTDGTSESHSAGLPHLPPTFRQPSANLPPNRAVERAGDAAEGGWTPLPRGCAIVNPRSRARQPNNVRKRWQSPRLATRGPAPSEPIWSLKRMLPEKARCKQAGSMERPRRRIS